VRGFGLVLLAVTVAAGVEGAPSLEKTCVATITAIASTAATPPAQRSLGSTR
jgi:hypothetical protein